MQATRGVKKVILTICRDLAITDTSRDSRASYTMTGTILQTTPKGYPTLDPRNSQAEALNHLVVQLDLRPNQTCMNYSVDMSIVGKPL